MMKYKDRTLLVLKYLQEHTDREKSVTTRELHEMLSEYGYAATSKTIMKDIHAIQDAGYSVEIYDSSGIVSRFAIEDRPLDSLEAQILIDAVSSSPSLPVMESFEMIDKLAELSGPSYQENLKPSDLVANRNKSSESSDIYHTIRSIQHAIQWDRMISFQYFRYHANAQQMHAENQLRYPVSPYAFMWKNDRYYLIAYSNRHHKIVPFQLNRISRIREGTTHREPMPDDFNLTELANRWVNMKTGKQENVLLRCRAPMLDTVFEQFGEQKIHRINDDVFEVEILVEVSDAFYGWLFQHVDQVTIISPDHVIQGYVNRLQHGLDDALSV